jgi:hypothetical protein
VFFCDILELRKSQWLGEDAYWLGLGHMPSLNQFLFPKKRELRVAWCEVATHSWVRMGRSTRIQFIAHAVKTASPRKI